MKRRALFIGVDEYDDPQIRNLRFSRIDAHSLNELFADIGYDVRYLPNPTKAEVFAAARERTSDLAAGDSFLFYFAGHGFTQGGHDLIFCRDDVFEDLRFDDAGLKFDKLRMRTESNGAAYDRVFIIDACRSDFLTGRRGGATYARDLVAVKELVKDVPKTGSLAVLRSCSPYQYALEIESRQHGLFTCALLDVMRAARREGTRLAFDESFGDAVAKTMAGIAREANLTATQTPDFAKAAGCAAQVLLEGRAAQSGPSADVSVMKESSRHAQAPVAAPRLETAETDMVEMFRIFAQAKREHEAVSKLSDEEKSLFADDIRSFEDDLAAAEEAKKCSAYDVAASLVTQALEVFDDLKAKIDVERQREPKPGDEMTITLPGGVPMTFCWCPATTSAAWKKISGGEDFFWMGSPVSEIERGGDETRHRVKLTQGFWMGKYEVTQRQWECVMGSNPSLFKGANRPVEQVSWNDCQEYIRKVTVSGQVTVALPTEAQWEYACRAGTTTPFNFGSTLNGNKANCDGRPYRMSQWGRDRKETSRVGSYVPNAWGLYDMHGNVWEWCADWYGCYINVVVNPTGPASGGACVCRGGGWNLSAGDCRAANRFGYVPNFLADNLGLRLVCSLPLQ